MNVGELAGLSQQLALYARMARSGSPQGFFGVDILGRLQRHALDARFHANYLESTETGTFFKSTFVTVQDISGAGTLISRSLSLWDVTQEIISCSLKISSSEFAKQFPPPREWFFFFVLFGRSV